MTEAIRYKANLAEEDPDGTLVGVEAIAELEERIEELYEEGTEIYDAAERLVAAVELAIGAGHCGGQKINKALQHWRQITGA